VRPQRGEVTHVLEAPDRGMTGRLRVTNTACLAGLGTLASPPREPRRPLIHTTAHRVRPSADECVLSARPKASVPAPVLQQAVAEVHEPVAEAKETCVVAAQRKAEGLVFLM
jgi:hypothetical protein